MADLTFFGEPFELPERTGAMALLRFAKVASGGDKYSEMEQLAAMYDLLQTCLRPEDWARFEETADKNKADEDELLQFVGEVMVAVADRPTKRPSDSSAGPTTTVQKSTSSPVERAMSQLDGRPDLQVFVAERAEFLAATS